MPSIQLDVSTTRMLLADWFVCLAREAGLDCDQRGSDGKSYTLGNPSAFNVNARFTDNAPFLEFVASDKSQDRLVADIVSNAIGHVQRADFGGIVWYSTELHEVDLKFSPSSIMGQFVQRLSSQTQIVGWRRLGTNILLEFVEEESELPSEERHILVPKAIVHVHIAAPGPCVGFFSSHIASGAIEIVGAVCTFALGRPVELPYSVFPSKSGTLPQLAERQTDRQILTLARKGTSLDIVSILAADGGLELFQRVRAALISFDAAVRENHDSVACILYVVAAECLSMPYTEWRRSKLTKRFIEFFEELMPTDLDQIVAHSNFEEAFSIRRGVRSARALRRELLDRMYDYRSSQLHEGLRPSYRGLGFGDDEVKVIRRALFYDFAEAAILRFLYAPRASLIGHPAFDRCQDKSNDSK